MKARPIIFGPDMIRALLDGRKTQTRRVVKPALPHGADVDYILRVVRCPYGQPGDLLWVRERLEWESYAGSQDLWYEADSDCVDADPPANWSPPFLSATEHWEEGDNIPGGGFAYWTGIVYSIHMPRWASRITLRLTDVRVERVQDIREEDARAEGIIDGGCLNCGESEPCGCADPSPDARDAFAYLWHQIHGEEGSKAWHANPWVWVLAFDVIQKNVDEVLADV